MACEHCGATLPHAGKCPSVKAVEYYPNGRIKRVEYMIASDYAPSFPYNQPYNPISPPQPVSPWWDRSLYFGSTYTVANTGGTTMLNEGAV